MPSQIDTRRDAIEFLTGQWALQPCQAYHEDDLDKRKTADLIDLARGREAEAKGAEPVWTWNFRTRIMERGAGIVLGQHLDTGDWLISMEGSSCKWTPLQTFESDDWLQMDCLERWKKNAQTEAGA